MKAIFLTSAIGGYSKTESGKIASNLNNSNYFVDRLKKYCKKIKNIVFVASNPDGYERTDEWFNIFTKAFNIDGFDIENVAILDHRFNGNVEEVVLNSDVVFLTGGHTPTQNKYLFEIGLDKILQNYNGVVIGQSAGSMNLAKVVYAPPETIEDLNESYKRTFKGLNLTVIKIMPHMALAFSDNVDGNGKNTYDFCIEDSCNFEIYGIYDGGFIEISNNKQISYGKTLLFKNGICKELCGDGEKIEISKNKIKEI